MSIFGALALPRANCTSSALVDYEDDESESGAEESGGRKKKKPWRYRWPDEVRDERRRGFR